MRTISGVGLRHGADGRVEFAPADGGKASRHVGQEHPTELTRAERRSGPRCVPVRVSGLLERSRRGERQEKHRGNADRSRALTDLASDRGE
jgi:hypothetical protein